MTTITIPRETFDLMKVALETIAWSNDSKWQQDCAKEALSAAKAVSEQPKGLFVDLIASHGPDFVAEMAAIDAEPQACDMGAMCLDCQPRGKNGECPDQQPQASEPAEKRTLYECTGCGHLHNERVSSCDCMENPGRTYNLWTAAPEATK